MASCRNYQQPERIEKMSIETKKYRPSLSAVEIKRLISAMVVYAVDEEDTKLIKTLKLFQFKIAENITSSAYELKGNSTDRLRKAIMGEDSIPDNNDYKNQMERMSPPDKRRFLYNRSLIIHDWIPTSSEDRMIKTYMWEKGLMNPEELIEFGMGEMPVAEK